MFWDVFKPLLVFFNLAATNIGVVSCRRTFVRSSPECSAARRDCAQYSRLTLHWALSDSELVLFHHKHIPVCFYKHLLLRLQLWWASDFFGKRLRLRFSLGIKSTVLLCIVLRFSFLPIFFPQLNVCVPFATQNQSCFILIFPFNDALVVFQLVLKRRGRQNKWASEQQLGTAGCYYIEVFVCTNEWIVE